MLCVGRPHVTARARERLTPFDRDGEEHDGGNEGRAQPVPREVRHETVMVIVGTRFDPQRHEDGRRESRSGPEIAERKEADLAESSGPNSPCFLGFSSDPAQTLSLQGGIKSDPRDAPTPRGQDHRDRGSVAVPNVARLSTAAELAGILDSPEIVKLVSRA